RLILVSRTPGKLARYARMGASVRYGDFTRPASLRPAFAGGTRMLLISMGFSKVPRPVAQKSAIDAAVADGVKFIAYTSWIALSRGDRTGLGADHYATEQTLKRSGVAWSMLRNSVYMEELLPEAARMAATGRAVIPAHEVRIGYVAREDCAAAAAAVLATPGHDDQVYDITGSELIGVRDVAAAVSAVTGKTIQVVPAAGAPAARRGFLSGPALAVTSPAVEELTGRPPMTLAQFLVEHRAELSPKGASRFEAAGTDPSALLARTPGTPPAHPGDAVDSAPPATPAAGADPPETASVIARLRLRAAPRPVRERKNWRPPRKVVLLAFDRRTAGERNALARVVPNARLVVARNRVAAIAAAADADVLIGFNPEICDRGIIDADRGLRWILSLAAGVEHCVDIPSVRRRHILITNMRGVDSAAIAEDAIALSVSLAHGLDVFAKDTARARWNPADAARTHLEVLFDKTMLVVGLGGIGTDVAQRAHALGMTVIATREHGHQGPPFVSYVGEPAELLALARRADVIVNTTPLTPATTGLYDAKFFAVLKPTAIFVNVARGASVVTSALTEALDEHRLGAAGLDVVDPEPLPPDDPLWKAPRLIVSPHIAGRSDLSGIDRWIVARENLRRYAAGGRMLSVVNLAAGY
ncbi:MAG: NAD(P)-dependent oxidoreductase, partial [Steroidobacteraceae bacterium]